MRSAIMRCGSASTTCIPPAFIPGCFFAISDRTPRGAFRITSTISRPRASTATDRACASAGSYCAPNALSFILIGLNKRLPRMLHARKKRRSAFLTWAALLAVLPLEVTTAFAQLRGHGGPVRALAISPDGQTAVTGSFDSTAIRWSLARNAAEQVLRFHADAVNAVVLPAQRCDAESAQRGHRRRRWRDRRRWRRRQALFSERSRRGRRRDRSRAKTGDLDCDLA